MTDDKNRIGASGPYAEPARAVARTPEQVRKAIARLRERIAAGEIKFLGDEASDDEFRQQMRDVSAARRARVAELEAARRAVPESEGNVLEFAPRPAKPLRSAASPARPSRFDGVELQAAASTGNGESAWTRAEYSLRATGRSLAVFLNPEEDNCVFIQVKDIESDWHALRIGEHRYRLAPVENEPDWVGLRGCLLETLERESARNGGNVVIDAEPTQ